MLCSGVLQTHLIKKPFPQDLGSDESSVDQSYNGRNWCIADFKLLTAVNNSRKVGWMWLKFRKALVAKYILPHHLFFSHLEYLDVLVFGISGIIHQELVAMLRGYVNFVHRRIS